MVKQLVTRVLVVVAVGMAVPVATAGSAFADGPANAKEAAICKALLDWATPAGLTPTSVDSVCTVKGNHK